MLYEAAIEDEVEDEEPIEWWRVDAAPECSAEAVIRDDKLYFVFTCVADVRTQDSVGVQAFLPKHVLDGDKEDYIPALVETFATDYMNRTVHACQENPELLQKHGACLHQDDLYFEDEEAESEEEKEDVAAEDAFPMPEGHPVLMRTHRMVQGLERSVSSLW